MADSKSSRRFLERQGLRKAHRTSLSPYACPERLTIHTKPVLPAMPDPDASVGYEIPDRADTRPFPFPIDLDVIDDSGDD